VKDSESRRSERQPPARANVRSDEGPTLEASALQIPHSGNSTLQVLLLPCGNQKKTSAGTKWQSNHTVDLVLNLT